MDIPNENLVYVPVNRLSTIKRLVKQGYIPDSRVTFFDVFGEQIEMRCLKKEITEEQFSPIWECSCGNTNDLRESVYCKCGKFYGEIE